MTIFGVKITLSGVAPLMLCAALGSVPEAYAFQIAPLGSSFEASLTNESQSSLARVAQRLGALIKRPVHEEITQLAFGCPADLGNLIGDESCAQRDVPFVTPYVIYGVRWNDLPPFQLSETEGRGCRKFLTGAPACRPDQTVRFSTQPECWICLFKDAQKTAQTKKIAGCVKSLDVTNGNLMTRSHFGDLQFLHAMASEAGTDPEVTKAEILDWIEFAWGVASKNIGPSTRLREVSMPTLRSRFACTEWTVADIYILGRNDKLRPMLHRIAFGSLVHVVQDSFSNAHADRASPVRNETCPDFPGMAHPGRIREFHTYAAQDGSLHDLQDTRERMALSAAERKPGVIEITQALFEMHESGSSWSGLRPLIECVFSLADDKRQSSPGDDYRSGKAVNP